MERVLDSHGARGTVDADSLVGNDLWQRRVRSPVPVCDPQRFCRSPISRCFVAYIALRDLYGMGYQSLLGPRGQ